MKALVLAATLAAASGPASAMAQDAGSNDVFGGYSMLAVGDSGCVACDPGEAASETLHGWHAALGWGLSGRLGLVLDLSGHQGTSAVGDDVDVLSAMAGPRFAFGGGRVRPFLHVLGGIVRTRVGVGVFAVDISESSTDFGGAAGGGLDLGLGGRWGARITGDYRMVRLDGETAGDPRFSAGVVYRFGAE